jgi:hypothetical protein
MGRQYRRRLHEALQKFTPADVYEGRQGDDLGPPRADQTRHARAAPVV